MKTGAGGNLTDHKKTFMIDLRKKEIEELIIRRRRRVVEGNFIQKKRDENSDIQVKDG